MGFYQGEKEMSFRCKECGKQIKQKQAQFKKFERVQTNPGTRTVKEDDVCYKCWKKDNGN